MQVLYKNNLTYTSRTIVTCVDSSSVLDVSSCFFKIRLIITLCILLDFANVFNCTEKAYFHVVLLNNREQKVVSTNLRKETSKFMPMTKEECSVILGKETVRLGKIFNWYLNV